MRVRPGFRTRIRQFPGSQAVRQALRPYPQYLDINTGADGGDRSGRSNYHALVLRGEKRYASGLTFLTSYVFSKTVTLRSDRANAGDGRAMNHFDRNADEGLSAFDQPHAHQVELQLRAAVRPRQAVAESRDCCRKSSGGWRVPASIRMPRATRCRSSPGYGLPLFGGDNRLTVLDDTGWRAPTQRRQLRSARRSLVGPCEVQSDAGRDDRAAAGIQGRRADSGVRQRRGAQPARARSVVPEREHLGRAHVRHSREHASSSGSRRSTCSIARSGATPDSTITSPNFGRVTGAGEPAAPDAAGVTLRVLTDWRSSPGDQELSVVQSE